MSDRGLGVGVTDGDGDTVACNSILLTGNLDPGASTPATQSEAGIRITARPANLTLENNVVSVNVNPDTGTLPHLAIAAAGGSVAEGDAGAVNASFVLTLSAANVDTVTVEYQTADGTAVAGQDYVVASGRAVFEPGTTVDTLRVAVTRDLLDEDDETFTVGFSNPVNAGLPDSLASGTILDDDVPVAVESAVPPRTFLGRGYRNPFSGRATIPFGLKETGRMSIRIFDVKGRLVRDLAAGRVERGQRRADWDGRDRNGERVASGVYILRMEARGKTFTQILEVIR